jgi:hypothetical protein
MRSEVRTARAIRCRARCVAVLCLAGCAGLIGAGCDRQLAQTSVTDRFPRPEQELDHAETLESTAVVTNNDMLHGFIVFTGAEDPWTTYAQRVLDARSRGWVPEDWREPANESATVGRMASIASHIVEIRGGLSFMILGPTPRYALRELIYQDILPARTENQSLSGLEFTDFLNRLSRMSRLKESAATRAASRDSAVPRPPSLPPSGRSEPPSTDSTEKTST